MSVGSFEKLKSKYLISAAVKSAVLGISAGLAAVGATLLTLKLCKVSLHFAFYILIGLGVAAGVFALFFFTTKPRDKKLAKKLDTENKLDEKIQTMLEYSDRSGGIIDLQREDAASRLDTFKVEISFKNIWYYILIAVLSLALFFTAIFIPAKSDGSKPTTDPIDPTPPIDEDTPWEYDAYIQAAMTELFWNIKDSSLEGGEKDAAIEIWTKLDTDLKTISTVREMQSIVYASIDSVDNLLNSANSFRTLRASLATAEEQSISLAIMKGVATYLSSGLKFTEMSHVVSVESLLGGYIETSLNDDFNLLCPTFKVSQKKGLKEFLDGYSAKISTALKNSGVKEDDPLYLSLSGFVSKLSAISAKVNQGYGDGTLFGDIDTAFGDFKGSLMSSLKPQSYRCMLDKFIRQKLAEIFGLPLSDLPEDVNDDLSEYVKGGGGGEGDNPGESSGGGYGTGEELFGGDDMIYDPVTGSYVKYGDILNAYADRLAEDTEGAPPDLKTFIEEYFNILHNGIKDESSEENK